MGRSVDLPGRQATFNRVSEFRRDEHVGSMESRTGGSVDLGGSGLTLWVQGRNLTNRLYVTDLANGLRPGAPRTVSVGVRVAF